MTLISKALQIKNETVANANTALRVGEMFESIVKNNTDVIIDGIGALPTAIAGVHTLLPNTTYHFKGDIDLNGERLEGQLNTCILGNSSENASITSTGLTPGTPLITLTATTPIRHITIKDVDTAFNVSGGAFDWYGVNLVNVPNIGNLYDFSNFIFDKGAFINSSNLIVDGEFDTAAIGNSLLSASFGTIISLISNVVVNRRFRITYSAVVASGSATALNVSTSANIPAEKYILDTVDFAGGGTYLAGVQSTDNKALFTNCNGIDNSRQVSHYYMNGNATVTSIAATGTPVKVLGVTTSGEFTQKFTNINNRATYTGAFPRIFRITATISIESGNNNQIGGYIALNGVVLDKSEVYATTSGNGKAEPFTIQTLVQLSTGDYIEIFAENKTSTTSLTATQLNVIITE